MMLLWVAAVVLMVLAALFVVLPLRHYQRNPLVDDELEQGDYSLELLRNELNMLEERYQSGDLNEADYRQQRLEVERRLLSERVSDEASVTEGAVVEKEKTVTRSSVVAPLAALLVIPLMTIGLYLKIGGSEQLEQDQAVQELFAIRDPAQQLAALEDIVRRWPMDYQSRFMLAGAYMSSERYQDAAQEYKTIAVQTEGRQAEPIIQQAQALYLAAGNRTTVQVVDLVNQALALAPENTVALSMAGISAFERGDYRVAINHWRKQSLLVRDPQALAALQVGIARAQEALGEPVTVPPPVAAESGKSHHVVVQVSLSPELLERVKRDHGLDGWPTDAKVFIFARAGSSTMPLAIVPLSVAKLSVTKLPTKIVLDDGSVMLDGESFANHQQVDVVARLSLSGEVLQADYEATVNDVAVNNAAVNDVIVDNSDGGEQRTVVLNISADR